MSQETRLKFLRPETRPATLIAGYIFLKASHHLVAKIACLSIGGRFIALKTCEVFKLSVEQSLNYLPTIPTLNPFVTHNS